MLGRLLAPSRCFGCDRGPWPVCAACRAAIAVAVPPWCARCGRPAEEPLTSCSECPSPSIDTARAPFVYDGPVARAIKGLKFSGWRVLGPSLAGAMAEVVESPARVVTWVPLSARRRRERGFDQAELLAAGLAARTGRRIRRLLERPEDAPSQARAAIRDRRAGPAGGFVAAGPVPPRVLLVDDVLTTGATAAAGAKALRRGGATRVDVVVAARALRGPVPARTRGGP